MSKMTDQPLLFDRSIQKLNVLFKYSGMNIKNRIHNKNIIQDRWVYIFNLLWVLSASVAAIYYIVDGFSKGKNFIELTSVAPCFTFGILAVLKSLFHLINEGYVQRLLENLRDLERKENERARSIEKKEEIINEETQFLNRLINVLYFLNCAMILVFDMTPLIQMAVKYYKTNKFEPMLPYLDLFSFIPYKIQYWPFAYIYEIWSESIVLLDIGAADYLFFTCCTYIRIQFRLLQHDFTEIITTNKTIQEMEQFHSKFVALVKWHQKLIDSSNILETIYSKSTLFNFLTSSLVICLTGFNVTIVDDPVVVVTFLTFLFMSLSQVFFLCFFADLLMSSSMEVSNAVYNCKWYMSDASIGKQLLLVQIRAQKPCKLTAAGFADVNLRSFMRVLSTAWSYFALLQTMYGG